MELAREGSAVSGRALWGLLAAAAGIWCIVFLWTPFNFWAVMALGTGGLAGAGILAAPGPYRGLLRMKGTDLLWGLGSAVALYGVFWAGREITTRLLPFAGGQIAAVYLNKQLLGPAGIAGLIGLVIGPAEELFWRGFVQREMAARYGPVPGWLLAVAAYAGVHATTGNVMLVVAAGAAGLVWGLLYLRTGRLWPGILSHVLWDLTVFLLLPLA